MSGQGLEFGTSDAELIESARSGDSSAFAELWRRHCRPATRVARQFTSIDADDLVSEAYVRIYQRILAGGGPSGAFRPYLYTTIRNLASTWGAARTEVQVDAIDDFEDERIPDDPAAWALDRTLTAQAFRALPDRWQTVLWYTEVEGMDPHEVAPLMGMTPNGVAALSYRAREGLRKAWLQAHIGDATASGECEWALSKMGEDARKALGARDEARLGRHLAECASCSIISEEVNEVGSRLALVMIPLLLGGVAGGTLLSSLAAPAAASAAEYVVPALPHAVEAIGAGGTAAASGVAGALSFGVASTTGAMVSSVAVAVALAGGIVLGVAPQSQPAEPTVEKAVAVSAGSTSAPAAGDDTAGGATASTASEAGVDALSPNSSDALASGGPVAQLTGAVGGVVADVGSTVNQLVADPVTLNISLGGTGTPGGVVSLKVGGVVYATTTVDSSGHFAIAATGVPQGSSLQLVQTVNSSLLGGLLGGLLTPLGLTANSSGLSVSLSG
ncbi:MAG TPA: sigma-70 family RNA polymerase sigma factor [Pseudolysinimonas sp.]|nr:sigma-70 family RNA polymerase sigma factor [Pseudolysinimonas sp.]